MLWSCNGEFLDFRWEWVCRAEKNIWTAEAMLVENVFFCRYAQCLLAAKHAAKISDISVVPDSVHIHHSLPFHSHFEGFFSLIITILFHYFIWINIMPLVEFVKKVVRRKGCSHTKQLHPHSTLRSRAFFYQMSLVSKVLDSGWREFVFSLFIYFIPAVHWVLFWRLT